MAFRMNQAEFLERIYQGIETGMNVLIPKRKTDIVEITESGEIVYMVADTYRKVLSKQELIEVYQHLSEGAIKTSTLRKIVTPSRTCNVSTIRWILWRFDLATEQADRSWLKRW
ncbi:MAG: hypothetical protein KTR18_12475 [Acidiferrobacterales bacterium]|nr:hypothetical protein [Acidiferrobacterales bacterium]